MIVDIAKYHQAFSAMHDIAVAQFKSTHNLLHVLSSSFNLDSPIVGECALCALLLLCSLCTNPYLSMFTIGIAYCNHCILCLNVNRPLANFTKSLSLDVNGPVFLFLKVSDSGLNVLSRRTRIHEYHLGGPGWGR